MKKLRGDPEKYLNERRRDVLRYVESKGSWPISQNGFFSFLKATTFVEKSNNNG
jgi:hypothetical protein